jgi:hypothetical protein
VEGLSRIISGELTELRAAGMRPTAGDIRCMALGHITRMAIWRLRPSWDPLRPTADKFSTLCETMNAIATAEDLGLAIRGAEPPEPQIAGRLFAQEGSRGVTDAIAF